MATEPLRVYVVAGEPSGDAIGAAVMRALARERDVVFRGVGGARMLGTGLLERSLFPMSELSIMGFAEVIPALWRLHRRLARTLDDACSFRPHLVLTIDSRGFNLRLLGALAQRRAAGASELSATRLAQYVCPATVWARRPGRAVGRTLALLRANCDLVLSVAPMDAAPLTRAGVPFVFVGHPALEPQPGRSAAVAHARLPGAPARIGVLPGSRVQEVTRLLPRMLEAVELAACGSAHGLVLPAPETAAVAAALLARHLERNAAPHVHWQLVDRAPAAPASELLHSLDAAVLCSGSAALEAFAMCLPAVVVYDAHPLSRVLIQRLAAVRFASLANLVADAPLVPECLFGNARAPAIAVALSALLADAPAARAALNSEARANVLARLSAGTAPSTLAAAALAALAGRA